LSRIADLARRGDRNELTLFKLVTPIAKLPEEPPEPGSLTPITLVTERQS
jgi:hypothetical protein